MPRFSEHECWICGDKLERSLAAVARAGEQIRYLPFVKDLEESGWVLAHPKCFAWDQGVNALVSLVHDSDYRVADKYGSVWASIR